MGHEIDCNGIVLAGGASRRFGSPKPLAEWEDERFIESAVKTLAPMVKNISVVTREELIKDLEYLQDERTNVITDVAPYKGNGPLAGLYSAMIQDRADFYMVIPCDMPLMKSHLYDQWLQIAKNNDYDCVVPILNGKVYPLNGVYHHSCIHDIKACLSEGNFKVMELLDRKNTYCVEVIKEEESFFCNINSKEELFLLKERKDK